MSRWPVFFFVVAAACAEAGDSGKATATTTPCSESWYRSMEQNVPTGDGQGHGPDIGSDEWKSVIEFKLGIRDTPNLPSRDSEAWCRHVDALVRESRMPSRNGADPGGAAVARGAFVPLRRGGSRQHRGDDLRGRGIARVYAAASEKATNEHPPVLGAEQRGWIKGRDDCWKSDDERGCVQDQYRRRIAELQARYRLVPYNGPVRFVCDGNPANEVVATFFRTDPPTLVAERGDSVSLMYVQPSGSGARYQGPNETFWEHQGEASISWGYGAPEMRCKKAP